MDLCAAAMLSAGVLARSHPTTADHPSALSPNICFKLPIEIPSALWQLPCQAGIADKSKKFNAIVNIKPRQGVEGQRRQSRIDTLKPSWAIGSVTSGLVVQKLWKRDQIVVLIAIDLAHCEEIRGALLSAIVYRIGDCLC